MTKVYVVCLNQNILNICRNAAKFCTELEKFSQVLAEAAEVVYQLFGRFPATIWQAPSFINIKLAGKMMNMTVPKWESAIAAACRRIKKHSLC